MIIATVSGPSRWTVSSTSASRRAQNAASSSPSGARKRFVFETRTTGIGGSPKGSFIFATPDVITVAKGITSAYAPMGAVIVSDRIAEPLYEDGRMLLHGITYGGHPVAAAIALQNIDVFEREGVIENVRAHEGYFRDRLNEIKERVPIVGDVRGAGFFWALELVRDEAATRFSAEERERLLRGFLTGRLLEEGLIARPDDRGDAVLHLAPPLICGKPELDELAAKTEAVLADASERFYAG